jgi:hypothetical protein
MRTDHVLTCFCWFWAASGHPKEPPLYDAQQSYIALFLVLSMPKRRRDVSTDIRWDDVIRTERPGHDNPRVECIHCSKAWHSRSIERLENHMSGCTQLPTWLWPRYNRGVRLAEQRQVYSQLNAQPYLLPSSEQRALDQLLAEAVYASGIPFSFVSKLYTKWRTLLTS